MKMSGAIPSQLIPLDCHIAISFPATRHSTSMRNLQNPSRVDNRALVNNAPTDALHCGILYSFRPEVPSTSGMNGDAYDFGADLPPERKLALSPSKIASRTDRIVSR